MSGLLAFSHPSLFSPNPKPFRLFSIRQTAPSLSFSIHPRNPKFSSPSALPGDGSQQDPRRIPINNPSEVDEWGEKVDPEPEAPSEADPPKDEDEWGREPGVSAEVVAEPERVSPSVGDPPRNDDEWAREVGGVDYLSGNGSTASPDKLGDLKRLLVDTLCGSELGLRTSGEDKAEILELISQLEAGNPTAAPTERPELLNGNWILLYTAFSELLPLLAVGATPLLKIKRISQEIDTKSMIVVNATTLSSPFATFSFSATASFEVRSPSRIQVKFKEGAFQPPEISSTVDLPENIDVFGQKVDMSPVKRTLNPVQEAAAGIARTISGQPPLKVRIPGNRPASWLLITYLDEDFRISRGDGGLFVLAKEGSPLLDQLL